MAPSTEPVIASLAEVWGSMAAAVDGLDDAGFSLGTACPGWSVRDQFSHLIGIERMLLGDPIPDVEIGTPAHIRNDIGAMNEAWIEVRRSTPGPDVVAEFIEVTNRRLEVLRATDQAGFDLVGWSPIGQVPLRDFMASRVLDSWVHEQDIRHALDRPGGRGGAGERITVDMCRGAMPMVVGKKAKAPEGARVHFELTGAYPLVFDVVIAGGRGALSDPADGAVVSLSADSGDFERLCMGRSFNYDTVSVTGDQALGSAVVNGLNFMF